MNPYLYNVGAFTTLNNDIISRSIFGGSRPSKLTKSVVPDFLLETFECSREDRYQLYNDRQEESPAYQIKFCPESNLMNMSMVAKEDGRVMLINTDISGSSAIVNEYQAHNNSVFDVEWLTRDKLLTCSGDSSIRYHDLEVSKEISRMTSHTSSVKALSLRPSYENQFASCSRDGSVLLWDLRSKVSEHDNNSFSSRKCVMSINDAHDNGINATSASSTVINLRKSSKNRNPKSVTGVVFIDNNTIVSSGATDNKIKFWDIRKLSNKVIFPVKTITHPFNQTTQCGYSDIIVNKSRTTLFANCKDNFIYQYNIDSQNFNVPKYRYTGHETKSYYIKMDLSPDENYIICGSSSSSAYIYRVGLVPQRPVLLNGHQGEVTVCRWCPSDQGVIMTVSDDCTAMVHRMRPGSDYNVFYRDLKRSTIQPGHAMAPVALSARYGEETVKKSDQIMNNTETIVNFQDNPKRSVLLPQFPCTPTVLKNQSMSSFLSPIAVQSILPVLTTNSPNSNVRKNFAEINTKIDRSKSVLIKKIPDISHNQTERKRNKPLDTLKENKENIKRRKTISSISNNQNTITNYFARNNDL